MGIRIVVVIILFDAKQKFEPVILRNSPEPRAKRVEWLPKGMDGAACSSRLTSTMQKLLYPLGLEVAEKLRTCLS